MIAEFPLESTLKLEEFKDSMVKEQGETETGDRRGKGEGSGTVNQMTLGPHWNSVLSIAHAEFPHKIIY